MIHFYLFQVNFLKLTLSYYNHKLNYEKLIKFPLSGKIDVFAHVLMHTGKMRKNLRIIIEYCNQIIIYLKLST